MRPPQYIMDQTTLIELKKSLEEEHEKLLTELKSIATADPKIKGNWNAKYPQFETGEYGSHSSLEGEADEFEEYEVRLEAEHSLESRLLQTNKALERLAQGTYGKCLKCGKEITVERLKANLAAEFCLNH